MYFGNEKPASELSMEIDVANSPKMGEFHPSGARRRGEMRQEGLGLIVVRSAGRPNCMEDAIGEISIAS